MCDDDGENSATVVQQQQRYPSTWPPRCLTITTVYCICNNLSPKHQPEPNADKPHDRGHIHQQRLRPRHRHRHHHPAMRPHFTCWRDAMLESSPFSPSCRLAVTARLRIVLYSRHERTGLLSRPNYTPPTAQQCLGPPPIITYCVYMYVHTQRKPLPAVARRRPPWTSHDVCR
ncbi:hypothetical protein K504DRAFT_464602 [Pleomassaria siparia CBS 279.74]|uniref:Uncharacterized protein n=1 Tax=Pleomassaria siparia CBS 279.74 TaxID=1314801 RepID=A0A6G1KIR2_9PLEO|nr:hypothetical protein K504DRAFT_464602 [Pleomassaria siparia CBS 279.74]